MDKETFLIKGELIGKTVKIHDCKDPTWIGRKGKIVDETKNTFVVEMDGKEKRIAKDIAVFEFEINGRKFKIEGVRLRYRPEDRVKKAR